MITSKQEEKIQILSDTELYPQAIALMRGVARKLPSTQINGLLNVSFGNTYQELQDFVKYQSSRSTWKASEQHIPDFYRRLSQKFKELDTYALTIINLRAEKALIVDPYEIKMAIAREFIQHLLAENDYMIATRAFQPADGTHRSIQNRSRDDQRGSQNRGGQR